MAVPDHERVAARLADQDAGVRAGPQQEGRGALARAQSPGTVTVVSTGARNAPRMVISFPVLAENSPIPWVTGALGKNG